LRPIDDSADWYVEIDGERLGPLRWSALVELLKLRGTRRSDRIWRPGLPGWIATDEFDLATRARIQRTLGMRLVIIAWLVATVAYVAETSRSWMDVVDGRLAAQAGSLGAIALPIADPGATSFALAEPPYEPEAIAEEVGGSAEAQ